MMRDRYVTTCDTSHGCNEFVTPLTTLDLGNDKNIIKTIGLKQFKAVTACQIKTLLAELNKCRFKKEHQYMKHFLQM